MSPALTASMRDAVSAVGSEKEYRAARALVAKPVAKATPATMAKLRKAKAYVEVFEKGAQASVEAILTLAGPPLTFQEHAARMAIYTIQPGEILHDTYTGPAFPNQCDCAHKGPHLAPDMCVRGKAA